MIKVKHFKEERNTEAPQWKALEKFINEEDKHRQVLHLAAYPTGPDHNLVVIYEEPTDPPA